MENQIHFDCLKNYQFTVVYSFLFGLELLQAVTTSASRLWYAELSRVQSLQYATVSFTI